MNIASALANLPRKHIYNRNISIRCLFASCVVITNIETGFESEFFPLISLCYIRYFMSLKTTSPYETVKSATHHSKIPFLLLFRSLVLSTDSNFCSGIVEHFNGSVDIIWIHSYFKNRKISFAMYRTMYINILSLLSLALKVLKTHSMKI